MRLVLLRNLRNLINAVVSNLVVKQGIKTEDELLSLIWSRVRDGEPDLQSFALNKTFTTRADLIATTWRMQVVSQLLQRSLKTRIKIISKTLKAECVETCKGKHWLKCAKSIPRNNRINQYFFTCVMRNALIKIRQRNNNIMTVGSTNCDLS